MAYQTASFSCAKCHNSQYETEEIRTTGKYSRFFDIQNKKFTAVSCTRCGYTEIFRGDSSLLGNFPGRPVRLTLTRVAPASDLNSSR